MLSDIFNKLILDFKNEESSSKIFLNSSLFASKIQSELDQKETEKESSSSFYISKKKLINFYKVVNFEEKNKTNNGFKSFFSKYKKEDNSFEEDRRVSLQNKGKSLYRFFFYLF